jgi:hypothetical protein
MFITNTSSSWSGIVLDKSFFPKIEIKFQDFNISLTNVAHVGKIWVQVLVRTLKLV